MNNQSKNQFDSQLYGMTTLIKTENNAGSGFFYQVLTPKDPNTTGGQWRKIEGIYLITNKHVALPNNNTPQKLVFHLREISNNKVEWLPIEIKQDELKGRILLHQNSEVDIVAIKIDDLIINITKSNKKIMSPGTLTNDHLPSNSPLSVDVTTDIIVASYPRLFHDTENKFPIVKSGIIASGWGLKFQGMPYFLIDAQLFPGSSGGLVISKPTNFAMINNNFKYNKEKDFVFLGVYSGDFNYEETLSSGNLTLILKNPYGLGIVWYSDLIPEIINNGIKLQ